MLSGCRSDIAHVTIEPEGKHEPYIQRFPRAYMSISNDGDYDIVLLSEGLAVPKTKGKVLYPTQVNELKQVVHIRVLWRALPGTHTDQPTATNSTIDWFVLSNLPDAPEDRIAYRGAGFVAIYPNGDVAKVVIRNATMNISQHSGDLVDPFGPSALGGTFTVSRNDGLVSDIISTLPSSTAAANP
jgi:hypothetical protein